MPEFVDSTDYHPKNGPLPRLGSGSRKRPDSHTGQHGSGKTKRDQEGFGYYLEYQAGVQKQKSKRLTQQQIEDGVQDFYADQTPEKQVPIADPQSELSDLGHLMSDYNQAQRAIRTAQKKFRPRPMTDPAETNETRQAFYDDVNRGSTLRQDRKVRHVTG